MKSRVVVIVIVFIAVIASLFSLSQAAETKAKQGTIVAPQKLQVPPKLQPGEALPDLIVEDVWLNNVCQINIRIKNAGTGDIPDMEYGQAVMRLVSGKQYKEFSYTRRLAPDQPPVDTNGALKKAGGSVEFNTGIRLDRSLSITVLADPLKKISESNEGNNQKAQQLNPQCPPQGQATGKDEQVTVPKGNEVSKGKYDPKEFEKAKIQALEKARQFTAQKKAVLKQKRDQELRIMNAQALTRIQTIKSLPRAPALIKSTEGSDATAMQTRMSSAEGRPTSSARIEGVTPQPVVPGQDLTVFGTGFGNTKGRVNLNLEGMWISLPIVTWRDSNVVVTIPAALAEIVGRREKDGRIQVHHADWGSATMSIRVGPDALRITPEITSISERTVRPGQIIFVEGKNFLSRGGKVRFNNVTSRGVSLGTTVEGVIDHWDDTVIAVHFREDLEGFGFNSIFNVEVENRESLKSNTKTFILDPNVDTDVLVDTIRHIAYHHCPFLPDNTHSKTGTYGTFKDVHLMNGWRLVTSELQIDELDEGRCVYTLRPPRNHTEYPGVAINITNREGRCETRCSHIVEIEGPRGFSYK